MFTEPRLKVYMTDFFYLLDQIPPMYCVLMYQKHQISLPVGHKTARPKAGDWERL